MNELGDRLRSAREASRGSHSHSTRRTGSGDADFRRLEADDRPVKQEQVASSADALRLAVESFCGSRVEVLPDGWGGHLSPDDVHRAEAPLNHPRSVDHAALAAVSVVLAVVRRIEDHVGAAQVIPLVDAQRRLVGRFATEARSTVRSEAVGLLSELEQYRGWLAIPGGQWQRANRHLDRAARFALEADDPSRHSTALSFSAYLAIRRRDFRAAEALSAAARRNMRVHPGLRTYGTFQRAEILARIGEDAEALRLLAETDSMLERLPPAGELPSSGYWYTPPFFLGQRAFVLQALGDDAAAGQAARDCLTEMPADWTLSEWAARRRELAELA